MSGESLSQIVGTIKKLSEDIAATKEELNLKHIELISKYSETPFLHKLSPFGMSISIILIILGIIYLCVSLFAPKNETTTTALVWTSISLLAIIIIMLTITSFVMAGFNSHEPRFWSNLILLFVFLGCIAALMIMLPKNYVSIWYSYLSLILAIIVGVFLGLNGANTFRQYAAEPMYINAEGAPYYFNLISITLFLSIIGSIVLMVNPSLLDWGKLLSGLSTAFGIAFLSGTYYFFKSDRTGLGTPYAQL